MPKCVLSQRESSKQVDIQNLPMFCVASLMGLRPKLGVPHPWSPPTLGRPFSYLLSSRHLRNLSLIYFLALATTEQPPSCHRRVIQTPPSSDIKIARLRFLFVLRLRTGIDLRDQADFAPARLVTIGSWFRECIGASGLLVVVGSWGSTTTKSDLPPLTERSGTPPISSGISFPGWSVSLSSVFYFLYSKTTIQKFALG
jgi:hypothetical protein